LASVLALEYFREVDWLVKINPGSKKMPNNDTKTHVPRDPHSDIPQPEMTSKGEYEYSLCYEVFKRREDYLSLAMARHKVGEAAVAGDEDQL
jgi:hypothetical protein